MRRQSLSALPHSEHGASLVEMAILLPLFMLLLMGAVDFGRALYLSTEIVGAAQAAAVYGAQNPTDTTGMTAAAKDDAPAVSNLSVTNASYGCECSDGTSYSASCAAIPSCNTTTEVYRVNVTVTGAYTPLFPWPGVPSSIPLSSSASMRSAGS
jgi:Flp pilus assembly protein TadG